MSIREAAKKWGVSYTVVRKWVLQGRVTAERVGNQWIITQVTRPPALPHGSLSPEQRKVWAWKPPTKKAAARR